MLRTLLLLMPALALAGGEDAKDLPLEGKTEKLAIETSRGSWMSVDVHPSEDYLVFDLLGDLYRLPLKGGQAEPISTGLGFDSQPVLSPDGNWMAFISDRSGSVNLWISKPDGSEARKLTDEKQHNVISPAWTPDSHYLIVTKLGKDKSLELLHIDGGSGVTLAAAGKEEKFWGVGATVSPDGEYVYFAQPSDGRGPVEKFPAAQIARYSMTTGEITPVTQSEGGGFRPALSPDGSKLIYGSRMETKTGLRIRDLATGDDRWLAWPVQPDGLENFRPPSRDVLPGYDFTPDGNAIVISYEGGIHRIDIATGNAAAIDFSVTANLDVGPDLTSPYRVADSDSFTATIIHDPVRTNDRIIASVLGRLYAGSGDDVNRLTPESMHAFKPVLSPDGRWLAFVSWSAPHGGHIYRMRSSGGKPERLTDVAAFYTDLVFSPDGETLFALRGNAFIRNQTFSEFGGLDTPLSMVRLPADGGTTTTIMETNGARFPHFGPQTDRLYLYDDKGLFSVQLDGTDRREVLTVTGPRGNRATEDPPQAKRVTISPDGRHAVALVNDQVWIMALAPAGSKPPTVDVRSPSLPAKQLTHTGADFLGWSSDSERVWWAIGHDYFERDLASVEFYEPPEEDENKNPDKVEDAESKSEDKEDEEFTRAEDHASVRRWALKVPLDRDRPRGQLLLAGVHLITMSGDSTDAMAQVLENQDLLIDGNRIVAYGPSGSVATDDGIQQMDLDGKFVVPGFIDTHAHWEFRTQDVLEPHNWSLAANLAFGVTSGLDVQTAHKDYFAYRDFVDAGMSVGQRAFMTGPGIFGPNDFQSLDETRAFLRRYSDHYRTKNIKSYLVGNRKQRQWMVLASEELGLMPTTEGGADQMLNLTHAIDGMHGNEHTLPDSPIFDDVVELYAETKTAYTPTLIVHYNGEEAREYFFTRTEVHDNEKLQRFYPHNRLDELTRRRPGWIRDDEFRFPMAAAQAAKIQRAGGLVGVGGHAELQGLGYHWEMWAFAMGGMTSAEVLRAATIDGARIIGIDQDLGSIEAGKLADLVILDANPLENIRNTTAIHHVIQNGRLYDGDTLDQIWPEQKPLPEFWWWDRSDQRFWPTVD